MVCIWGVGVHHTGFFYLTLSKCLSLIFKPGYGYEYKAHKAGLLVQGHISVKATDMPHTMTARTSEYT